MSDPNETTVNNPFRAPGEDDPGTGQIVIRLALDVTIDTNDLRELAEHHGFENLRKLLDNYPDLPASRVIQQINPAELRKREAESLHTDFPALKTLTAYWRLDASELSNVESLRTSLVKMEEVHSAYHETDVQEACPSVTSNPLETDQGYLNDAPQGIGARSAWRKSHGEGHGINVIDLESGWILTHEDLPKPGLLYNSNGAEHQFSTGDHGAAVLAVIGSKNNDLGVIGIAPKLASLNVVSHFLAVPYSIMHVADAIGAATKHLNAGDMLLLEVQRLAQVALPTEIHSADLHAIRQAAAQGIIVIEAAGNGNSDLSGWTDPAGEHALDCNSSAFTDSGAVFVGAGTSDTSGNPVGHARYYSSNYGNRVDCYAWGSTIVTAGYGTLAGSSGGNSSYASDFGQTSGATAIIAGVAAVVQGYYKARYGNPLTPVQMRSVLSNRCTGTPQTDVAGQAIGVMPDLRKILGWRLSLLRILWRLLPHRTASC